jgi:hypothetical protein
MLKRGVVLLGLALLPLSGCASSSTPPPQAAQPVARRPFDSVSRVAVVANGESRFAVFEHSAEPGRTFDEVLKWNEYGSMLRPLAALVHQGINWLIGLDRANATAPDRASVSPRLVVAAAFARTLEASGYFQEIRTMEREPVGADRAGIDAIARVMVPEWGLVRIRDGDPALMSAFVNARGQMAIRGTGVIVWESSEDVTDPERLPLESFQDRRFSRQQLVDVLERAGQRLASELLYARSGGR